MSKTAIEYTNEYYLKFQKEYFDLNPNGNMLQAFTNILEHIRNGLKNCLGDPLYHEDLVESYSAYLVFWNRTYAQTDEKFISKENRLMNPEMFINTRSYQTFWHSPKTSRDQYLFGNTTEDYRNKRLEEFLDGVQRIPRKTKKKKATGTS